MVYNEEELIDKYFHLGEGIYERQIIVHCDQLIQEILSNIEYNYTITEKNNKIYYNIED